jgi:hypothetical protein
VTIELGNRNKKAGEFPAFLRCVHHTSAACHDCTTLVGIQQGLAAAIHLLARALVKRPMVGNRLGAIFKNLRWAQNPRSLSFEQERQKDHSVSAPSAIPLGGRANATVVTPPKLQAH